ncbi:exopolygalacturonase-like [Asparagus officinalis]|uniref:exopolygalacturonase-like n=1 Tax=Asparagus officinalis TaxID=4686 RepID=UPI00098DE4F0|nr:exopolygalacturonase-like [Asparagus officinalis]
MGSYSNFSGAFLLFLFVSFANGITVFDLKKYGGVPNGKTDSTKALQKAWDDACAAEGSAQITIPFGDYLVGPVLFKGKCKGPITIQLDGNLLADTNLNRYTSNWLEFQYIDGLTIRGRGKLDGQGTTAWPHNNCPDNWKCKLLPMVNFDLLNIY